MVVFGLHRTAHDTEVSAMGGPVAPYSSGANVSFPFEVLAIPANS